MTGRVAGDTDFYLAWEDSFQAGGVTTMDMDLSRQEKIYLKTGWSFISTTIDKTYYDLDGVEGTGWNNMATGTALLDSTGVATRTEVEIEDIEDVLFTISSAAGYQYGWSRLFAFDEQAYTANQGVCFDWPTGHPDDSTQPGYQNQVAYFGAGYGYYIRMSKPGVLVLLGDSVTNAVVKPNQPYTRDLMTSGTGWNMVGYWSNILRMVVSGGPPVINFQRGDLSTVIGDVFPLPPGSVDSAYLTPDQIFAGAGALALKTTTNNSFENSARAWYSGVPVFDFRYIGPGMASWVNAQTSPVQFD
jgi:hypothetical protein